MEKPSAPQIMPASRLLAIRLDSGPPRPMRDAALLAEAEAALRALAESYPDVLVEAATGMARLVPAGGQGGAPLDVDALYRHAHDVKGQAASVGYPMATRVAQSLCLIIDRHRAVLSAGAPPGRIQVVLRAHVEALFAIARSRCAGDGGDTGRTIVTALAGLVATLGVARTGNTGTRYPSASDVRHSHVPHTNRMTGTATTTTRTDKGSPSRG
ncbi:MAG: Hpt domain-containing protein [Alphaproteobacteria bacterium]